MHLNLSTLMDFLTTGMIDNQPKKLYKAYQAQRYPNSQQQSQKGILVMHAYMAYHKQQSGSVIFQICPEGHASGFF